jgi:hypothetical protein
MSLAARLAGVPPLVDILGEAARPRFDLEAVTAHVGGPEPLREEACAIYPSK